jgi:hypothetical protein
LTQFLTLTGVGGSHKYDIVSHHYLFVDGRYLDLAYADLLTEFFGATTVAELDFATI